MPIVQRSGTQERHSKHIEIDNLTSLRDNVQSVKLQTLIPSPLPCTPPVYLRPRDWSERFHDA